jgi:predicted nuclease of predicted toxin-antitoxin system
VIVWVDAQLSPALAPWLAATFGVEALSVRHLGLAAAKDVAIFRAAREANAVVITKDADFVALLDRFGPPPRLLWLRCGNTSNAHLRTVLTTTFRAAVDLFRLGEPLVEIA